MDDIKQPKLLLHKHYISYNSFHVLQVHQVSQALLYTYIMVPPNVERTHFECWWRGEQPDQIQQVYAATTFSVVFFYQLKAGHIMEILHNQLTLSSLYPFLHLFPLLKHSP